jgi:hypothetical protein
MMVSLKGDLVLCLEGKNTFFSTLLFRIITASEGTP